MKYYIVHVYMKLRGAFGKFLAQEPIYNLNRIMFGIILKSYLSSSSMLWHIFHENVIMQTKIYYCEYMYCLYNGKRKISVENITFYLMKSVQNINNSA